MNFFLQILGDWELVANLFVRLLLVHSMKWKIFVEPIVEAVMRLQFPIEATGTIPRIAAIRTIFGIGIRTVYI